MTIPFRDLREEDLLGLAGFLRFIRDENRSEMRGALFLINARGEPIEFSFSRIEIQTSFLWREGDSRRHATARLASALFRSCPREPALLLVLAGEVHANLFSEEILLDIPLCRVASRSDLLLARGEPDRTLDDSVNLYWSGNQPASESPVHMLLEALSIRELIMEPFERAAIGLSEAFRE